MRLNEKTKKMEEPLLFTPVAPPTSIDGTLDLDPRKLRRGHGLMTLVFVFLSHSLGCQERRLIAP
jgi:hypothetical protein